MGIREQQKYSVRPSEAYCSDGVARAPDTEAADEPTVGITRS